MVMTVTGVHTPTGSLTDFNSSTEAKGAGAPWMVSALTSVGRSVQNGHLVLHRDACLKCFLSLEM